MNTQNRKPGGKRRASKNDAPEPERKGPRWIPQGNGQPRGGVDAALAAGLILGVLDRDRESGQEQDEGRARGR